MKNTETAMESGRPMVSKLVLFVCHGNICRSPMAQGFLKKMLEDFDEPVKIEVLSAGLNAYGGPPTSEAIKVMRGEGIDISSCTSRQLTKELVEKADLILAMKKSYKDRIISWNLQSGRKVFTLKEFAGETDDLDIGDPYGRGIAAYEACAKEIELSLIKALKKIVDYVS
jgi:protein-tyrosine-phosphatase